MRFTIIRETNTVAVDSLAFAVDCSALPVDVHAIQWDGTFGEIEYAAKRCDHCGARSKQANATIRDMSPYQTYLDAWILAKAEADQRAAEVAAAVEKAAAAEREKAEQAANAAGQQG